MYRYNTVFQPLFAENRPMLAFRALGDVTIVTAMSTLVGLELWTDHIGPQTKEQAPPFLTHSDQFSPFSLCRLRAYDSGLSRRCAISRRARREQRAHLTGNPFPAVSVKTPQGAAPVAVGVTGTGRRPGWAQRTRRCLRRRPRARWLHVGGVFIIGGVRVLHYLSGSRLIIAHIRSSQ